MIRSTLFAVAVSALAAGGASAAGFKPAIVYDLGGKFDKSFNESAFTGATKFKEDTSVDFRDFEIQNDSQREQALSRFARQGFSPIVSVGFSHEGAVSKVAPQFPDTQFVIVDSVVDLPNVRSIVFKEHEGSYLAGVAATLASQTKKVGFVGGMDIALIRKFACGYVQGVKATDPAAEVFQNMTGTTGAAWADPVRGGELAKSQMARGADVVYHAAGGTGEGVLQAVADAGKLGIGVDKNQNALHPGHVLTSMVKRVDTAVYDTFKEAQAGEWTPGLRVFGLAEDGVALAVDENNQALITEEIAAAIDAAREGIISGEIAVHDYMTDSACPVQ
ncbi:BMP family ABC transporter substrate-binding protein [Neomegalonema sp.]|uniref:BMP family lipoprotein n=1 Tax=Neomegalonema sp. TaxID=2039713 RepID=UPI002625165E|nr:BMP family ABC transporter substrate-binding protein [Neomegalonema sp.]MDD2869918.1 BMP family ABC transporter substrate-binding protein [Neomegalonema sp.]